MSKQLKGVGVWLIVLVLMIAGLSYLGEKLQTQNNYSYKELEEDLENHRVAEAVIHQNQQTPTSSIPLRSFRCVRRYCLYLLSRTSHR